MPRDPAYLAFDLGASSGRGVLGTLDGDRMTTREVHRFETPVVEDGDRLSWDIGVLWEELKAGLRAALEEAPELASLSVDSWAVDYVALDGSGEPVALPRCYRDPRTAGRMGEAFETMPAREIYGHTGIQFLPFNTLFQLLADRKEDGPGDAGGGPGNAGGGPGDVGGKPGGPDGASVRRYLPMADYFNYRFSGTAVVEVSMASTTQLMDVRTRAWSPAIFDAFGLAMHRWPAIVPSGTRLGPTPEGVEVIATCSHDTGAAVAAAPATGEKPWAYVSSGTWSLLGTERTEPLVTDPVREAGFTHEAGVDGTLRFLRNLTGLWALQECMREWGDDDWDALLAEAAKAEPGLARIDLEDPRFIHRGGMEARLLEACRETGQPVPEGRGQLARVILESIAASYDQALADVGRLTGTSPEVLHIFGGGSLNGLLCQLAANACGVPVVAGPAEATALGNLILQARTLGHLPDGVTVRDVAARSSTLKHYEPDTETVTHD